ncbi:hypothetical protein L7F22_009078 [Adiantum nelumboides]|nr:hypothetical protein [Adiantum nelumboides]
MDLQCSLQPANNGEEEHQTSSSTEEDISDQSQNSLSTESTPPPNVPQRFPIDVSSNSPIGDAGLHHAANGILPSQPIQNGTKAEGNVALDDDKKREHKRRSKNWTRAETLKLIKMRTELDERFRRSGKKAMLWEEIALALQKDKFSRDGQQCKDKWEKLTAAYKEVRDGTREKSEHPFFNELNALLSWKSYKKECDGCCDGGDAKRVKFEFNGNPAISSWNQAGVSCALTPHLGTVGMTEVRFDHGFGRVDLKEVRHGYGVNNMDMNEARRQASLAPKKRKGEEVISSLDCSAVRELLDSIITRQQSFLKDWLDALDRRECLKEQMRHEREEKWRAEEREQRFAFNTAMIRLTQRLLGERPPTTVSMDMVPACMVATTSNGGTCTKKRSKNWKKSEVANLIRMRQEMDNKFVMSTRRAGLWDELGEKLASLGTQRDGKQCREKWDKLMAEYKDVVDGRKDKDESTYFGQLSTMMGKFKEGDAKSSSETTKDDCASDKRKNDCADKRSDECVAAVDKTGDECVAAVNT